MILDLKMENQYLLNPLHFEPSPVSSSMPNWETISSSAMEIQPTVLNCSSDHQIQTHDGFFNPTWDKSTDQALHFDSSALSSIVSSSSPASSNESLMIRELIGKLGTTNEISISPHSSFVPPLMNNHLVKENLQNLGGIGKQIPLNSTTEFSADPGFVERAAKFSCFGSRSFSERNGELLAQISVQVVENGKLNRVSSSPSLKNLGSRMEYKNCSQLQEQDRMEVANSQEESTISEQNPNGDLKSTSPDFNSRKRKASSKGKASNKGGEGSEDSNAKTSKVNECHRNENGQVKVEEESKGGTTTSNEEKQNKSNSKPPEAPKDYIHVRARRGQATDSHSLAERVRREKISERMKLLQDLVPGCNKVTGKALMLDEIINYVQSLQRQVEFLSMKLASVNTRMDFSIDSLVSKDIFQSNNNSMAQPIFPIDSSVAAFYGQQNPAIHNNIPNRTVTHCSVDPFDTSLCQNLGVQLPPLNGFNETASQYPLTFSEDDLHTIVQMGFGQTGNRNTPVQSPTFNGSNQAPQMKVEL